MKSSWIALPVLLSFALPASANPSDMLCHAPGKPDIRIDLGTSGASGAFLDVTLAVDGGPDTQVQGTPAGWWVDDTTLLLRVWQEERGDVLKIRASRKGPGKAFGGTLTVDLPAVKAADRPFTCTP
jgi:hypothetical protein